MTELRCPFSPCTVGVTTSIPVKIGIRQVAVTSPPLFDNTVLMPQERVLTICISKNISSLANYADDILDISRTAFGI